MARRKAWGRRRRWWCCRKKTRNAKRKRCQCMYTFMAKTRVKQLKCVKIRFFRSTFSCAYLCHLSQMLSYFVSFVCACVFFLTFLFLSLPLVLTFSVFVHFPLILFDAHTLPHIHIKYGRIWSANTTTPVAAAVATVVTAAATE